MVPNTAVQAQWAAAWDNSFPSSDRSASKCGTERGLASAMNVLTYQSLAVIDAETDSTVRREVLRNRDQQALLDLLHPNGRAVIERAATLGPWTLVLDECHHLLATWGALVSALASVLGAQTALIGLTATPATELTAWQHTLHDELFGTADFVIPTPALVREGDLAPYQELVYLTQPTPEEQAWIGTHRARFADLMLALIDQKVGSMSLAAWLHTRIVDRATREGNQIAWSTFERAEPDLACSGLRFAYDGLIPLPDGVRLREQHRIAPDAQDWVNVLTDFSVGHLQQSADPRDAHALTAIKRVLPPDRHGCRRQRRRRRTRPTLAVGIPASCRQRPAIPGRGEDPQGFTLAKHPRWARADAKGPESNGFRGLLRLLAPVRLVRITRAVHAAVAVEQCCYLNFPRPTTSGSGMATACELAG